MNSQPYKLTQEYQRYFKGHHDLVTAIHHDRITKLTCEVKDDTALGVVHFDVSMIYSGKFDYAAERKDGKWRIMRIAMPHRKIELKRQPDGSWKKTIAK